MEHIYFISYNHKKGFGCTEVFLEQKIKSFKDIRLIKEFIEKQDKVKEVVILFYSEVDKRSSGV